MSKDETFDPSIGGSQDETIPPSTRSGRPEPKGVLSDEKRRLLELYLGGNRPASPVETAAIEREPAGGSVPLSFEQELIWTHAQLAPDLPLYNEILTVGRTGPLDVTALERALTDVVRRHGAWRTTFDTVDGRAAQILQPSRPMELPVVDLSHLAPAEREREAKRVAEEEARRPIDLVRGPVVRATLVRLAPTEHRLYLVLHQIVHDGVSVYAVLLPELVALYEAFAEGRPSPLTEPPLQYGDFASDQRRGHRDGDLEASLAYWRRQLADAPTTLEVPTDHARPAAKTFRGGQHAFALSRKLTVELKALSQREGVTLYVTLLAAFTTLLHRYSGQEDVVVGTAISTRRHPDVDRLLGVFLNTIVLRTRLSEGMSFRRLLAHERDVTLEGLSHGDVPFHRLVKDLQPRRDPGYNPFFQVTFVLEPPMPDPAPGWRMTQMDVDTGVSRVDLYLQMDERPEGLVGHMRYSTDLWERATIERLAEHYVTLLEGVVRDPERSLSSIPMLTERERHPEPVNRDAARPAPAIEAFERGEIEQSLVDRFRKQVAKHKDRIAVKTARAALTYDALDRARRKVGCALVDAGSGPGKCVALLLDHDAPMLAGILGALSSGRAYVALDPTHPIERSRQIVEDAGAIAILSSGPNVQSARELARGTLPVVDLDAVLRGPEAPEPEVTVTADTIAYVLYTSGSTGKPKGVVQNHRNVLHFIAAYTQNLGLTPDDRLTLLPSYGVDAAVMDIFAALLNGAMLCPLAVREEGLRGVVQRITDLGVTVYHSTPTLFRHVLRELSERPPRSVRLVVLGGEEVRRSDVEAFRERFPPECVLVNGFGPTESTVSLQYFVDRETRLAGRSVPIGRPVPRTEVALLSRAGVPGQVHGEIAIVSPHVALGYWQAPELTQRAFVQGHAGGDGQRVYKTGDLGRLLPDGNIEYRGRLDTQTKILGVRVELGEIEAALAMHPGIKETAAVVREVGEGDKQIVAYFAAEENPAPTPDELRRFLRSRLPTAMIPTCIVRVERLPWTASGKLDRLALPDPEQTPERDRAPAADDLEQRLATLWAHVLRVAVVGVNDDFFELGGDSMMALQLMARIESELGVNLPLAILFGAPTVRLLADVLRPDVSALPAEFADAHAPAGEDRSGPWWKGVRRVLGRASARVSGLKKRV